MLVRALLIGNKIETRKLQKALLFNPALKDPYIINLEKDKYIVVFKYGVVVFWGLVQDEIDQVMVKINDYVDTPIHMQKNEEIEVTIGTSEDKIKTSHLDITELSIEKIAIISEVLSKSVALEHFEEEVEEVLDLFGVIINGVSKGEKIKLSNKALLKKVGFAMNIQHLIISQLAILDKPALTWDSAKLDVFHSNLTEEYEIDERYSTLSKKLEVIFRNIDFIMNFLDSRRGFYMELIIIALIALEVVLFIFE